MSIARLRELKASLAGEEHFRRLEPLLLDLARLYEPSEREKVVAPPPLR